MTGTASRLPRAAARNRPRRAALGRTGAGVGRPASDRTVRILTYNVHRCTGRDRQTSPERIAEVIAEGLPDIVALQEVDVHRARTGGVDQADAIARALGMKFHFNTVLRVEDAEGYGDAIMTALPTRLVRARRIPGVSPIPGVERRGALWVCVEVEGTPVQVVTTHLGLSARERRIQLDSLFGENWLGSPECKGPRILLGDFNAIPGSRAYRRIAARMRDAQTLAGSHRRATWPAVMPFMPLDHVFLDSPDGTDWRVREATVLRSPLARVASDHLPVVVSADVPDGGA